MLSCKSWILQLKAVLFCHHLYGSTMNMIAIIGTSCWLAKACKRIYTSLFRSCLSSLSLPRPMGGSEYHCLPVLRAALVLDHLFELCFAVTEASASAILKQRCHRFARLRSRHMIVTQLMYRLVVADCNGLSAVRDNIVGSSGSDPKLELDWIYITDSSCSWSEDTVLARISATIVYWDRLE